MLVKLGKTSTSWFVVILITVFYLINSFKGLKSKTGWFFVVMINYWDLKHQRLERAVGDGGRRESSRFKPPSNVPRNRKSSNWASKNKSTTVTNSYLRSKYLLSEALGSNYLLSYMSLSNVLKKEKKVFLRMVLLHHTFQF